jgi:hypothetical protein
MIRSIFFLLNTLRISSSSKVNYYLYSGFFCLVQMESLLSGGHEQPLAHHLLGRVVGQLQVVHTRVDGGIRAIAGVDLSDNRQSRE